MKKYDLERFKRQVKEGDIITFVVKSNDGDYLESGKVRDINEDGFHLKNDEISKRFRFKEITVFQKHKMAVRSAW